MPPLNLSVVVLSIYPKPLVHITFSWFDRSLFRTFSIWTIDSHSFLRFYGFVRYCYSKWRPESYCYQNRRSKSYSYSKWRPESYCYQNRRSESHCYQIRRSTSYCYSKWRPESYCYQNRRRESYCYQNRRRESYCYQIRNRRPKSYRDEGEEHPVSRGFRTCKGDMFTVHKV